MTMTPPTGIPPHAGRNDEAAFVDLRPLLFSIAYQMTGSVVESEDIVSDAYLRLRGARERGTEIHSLRAYLSSTVTRLSIDYLRSARVTREMFIGPWLPEPLVDDATTPEFERVELADSLSMAFLVLLESLSPTERAVFVLREIFVFGYPQIAGIIGKSEAYCRQLLHRARVHIDSRKPRFDVNTEGNNRLADLFFAAVQGGDLDPLINVRSADVVAYGDGGGNRPSLSRPVNGRDNVLRLLASLAAAVEKSGLLIERVPVNGQPGAFVRAGDGRPTRRSHLRHPRAWRHHVGQWNGDLGAGCALHAGHARPPSPSLTCTRRGRRGGLLPLRQSLPESQRLGPLAWNPDGARTPADIALSLWRKGQPREEVFSFYEHRVSREDLYST
jgi:RNA polymerase sigma-70 factor, ECF subfamily